MCAISTLDIRLGLGNDLYHSRLGFGNNQYHIRLGFGDNLYHARARRDRPGDVALLATRTRLTVRGCIIIIINFLFISLTCTP